MKARPDPTDAWPPEVFRALDEQDLRTGVPVEALLLRLDPLGRLASGYPAAMFALAEAARLRWRVTGPDLKRLHAFGRGDATGGGWLLCLAAVVHLDPRSLPVQWPAHARVTVARTIRVARRILRHDYPEGSGVDAVARAMIKAARDLRWPLERRVYEQWWPGAVKRDRTMPLEIEDLLVALRTVTPPTPREVAAAYTRALNALTAALARIWMVRREPTGPNEVSDRYRLKSLAARLDVSRTDLKGGLLRDPLLACLSERNAPTAIRRKDGYIRDASDDAAQLRPADDVALQEFLRWLKAETIRRAETRLRESYRLSVEDARMPAYLVDIAPKDAETGEPIDDDPPAGEAGREFPTGLEALEAQERHREAAERLDARKTEELAAGRLTERQAEVLDAIKAALYRGYSLVDAQRAAADDLGISYKTVSSQVSKMEASVEKTNAA